MHVSVSRLVGYWGSAIDWGRRQIVRRIPDTSDRSLRRRLLVGVGVAIACTAVLAGSVIARAINDYRHAAQNLREIADYRLVLDAANILSAERGPSNSVLGDATGADPSLRERLAAFRARSNATLDRLSIPAAGHRTSIIPASFLTPVRSQLVSARQEIDRLTAVPRAQRGLMDVQSAIENMFQVVDIFQKAIVWKVRTLAVSNPDLAAALLTGQIFGELREYGGRIASQIMAPIAVRQPLEVKNLVDSNRTRGRLLELWRLTGAEDSARHLDPRLSDSLRDTESLFFGEGLAMFDSLVATGRQSGDYSMTANEFTVRFVRTLEPLERLRRVFLDITVEHFAETRSNALVLLLTTLAVTAIILVTLLGLVFAAQTLIFAPLIQARNAVINLAADRSAKISEDYFQDTEMRRLFDAIEILRINLAERGSLMRRLRQQAETDGLTGLMNRRALDLIGERGTDHHVADDEACMILMDLDHFKTVNDRYGHLEGDLVLKESVQLVRSLLRSDDIFARFGGEEFVILTSGRNFSGTILLAERIRRAMLDRDILLSNGTPLRMTASFGVAQGSLGPSEWPRIIEAADAALYRAKSDGRNCVRFTRTLYPPAREIPDDVDATRQRTRSA